MTQLTFTSTMDVEVDEIFGEDDYKIVRMARVSTQGADASVGDKPVDKFIDFLMKNRHGSPFEHCGFTFRTTAPIFVWREHMRHRIASYNEESGRYKQLDPRFYVPAEDRALVQIGKPGAYEYVAGTKDDWEDQVANMKTVSQYAYDAYESALMAGVAREVARMILPLNIYSTAFVTMNLRGLMNFLSLRTKKINASFPSFPQREIEMVADQYEEAFAHHFPMTYRSFDHNGRIAP